MQVHPGKHVFLSLLFIFEAYIVKIHASVSYIHHRILRTHDLGLFIQHLVYTPCAGKGPCKQQKCVGDHHKGVHDLQHIA